MLGQTYQHLNRFDEAIKAYEEYKKMTSKKNAELVSHYIETCQNGKELVKYPIELSFENLGKTVNSPYADYLPFITADESTLMFTSRRKETTGRQAEEDGLYPSDILVTSVVNNAWQKPKSIGSKINTPLDEEIVGLSPDGNIVTIYIDRIDSLGNIYIAEKEKNLFKKMVVPSEEINAGFESAGSASISKDGYVLFFASERPGGSGGRDIYMSKRLPNGLWGVPRSLGNVINTPYHEDFPQLSPDGKTLYFSSQGHSSMGGFDVFKSIWDEFDNVWSTPVNIGYPLNTSEDNYNISFTRDNRIAYVTALRPEGLGDWDIYRVKFKNADPKYSIVVGTISVTDTTQKLLEAEIVAVNAQNGEELFYKANSHTGHYVMALLPGKYNLTIKCNNYPPKTEVLTIFELGTKESTKDIVFGDALLPGNPSPTGTGGGKK